MRLENSISQRRGVITLIPKEDSDLLDLQNWRPITLLNIDYNIASKTLAKRIENVLPKLVHPDQTGFMKEDKKEDKKEDIRSFQFR